MSTMLESLGIPIMRGYKAEHVSTRHLIASSWATRFRVAIRNLKRF